MNMNSLLNEMQALCINNRLHVREVDVLLCVLTRTQSPVYAADNDCVSLALHNF